MLKRGGSPQRNGPKTGAPENALGAHGKSHRAPGKAPGAPGKAQRAPEKRHKRARTANSPPVGLHRPTPAAAKSLQLPARCPDTQTPQVVRKRGKARLASRRAAARRAVKVARPPI